MAGNVYFFTKMTDETGRDFEGVRGSPVAGPMFRRSCLTTSFNTKSIQNLPEAHRNGNARFTIFTKDEDIEIKWLKSKFCVVKKIKKVLIAKTLR